MTVWLKILLSFSALLILFGLVAACSPVRTINALTPGSAYVKTADVAYGLDPRQKLDIYTPSKTSPTGSWPVVVFFYGGTWNSGQRADYLFVAEALASRGILCVLADYRLYPQVRYPAFLQDGALAMAYVSKEIQHYGGDPKRLFVMGHSAGAYNAAMLALDPRWLAEVGMQPSALRGWIGLAGPYDFIPITNVEARPVFFYPDTPADSQPINHVSSGAPSSLLIAPLEDKLVNPVRNTTGLANKLRAAGVPVQEFHFDKTSHVSLIGSMAWPLRSLAPTLDTVSQFVLSDAGRNPAPLVSH
ncbi:alpha/beta hydrolase [Undibacterium sp. Jales W-56]|uniref:alpha/beta hydrolase n=1 Tax=Undibacterium sp. Jales W-56 TaxID=2897325 RepID=UPI0021D27C41|nr:alpha/beta hydrolase [Undibacterium sp. Jales W-56]MCU6434068.1 alpha/beta hydrolase [Undibacterium sp. Jales W-56]